jgi:hypothetical protein
MTVAPAWTPATVESSLRAALVTLRRLPSKNLFPAGIRAAWPEVVVDVRESYGWDRARAPRIMPSAQDIQAMDNALRWVSEFLAPRAMHAAGLPIDTSAIVLARCAGATWGRLAQSRIDRWMVGPKSGRLIPGGNSITRLRGAYNAGIGAIVTGLGGAAMPVPAADEMWVQEVQGAHVSEQRVAMVADEAGAVRPVVQTTHYRARMVTRKK